MYVHVLTFLNASGQENDMLAYIEQASLAAIDAKKVYREFVKLLPRVIDNKAEARIKAKAQNRRALKVQYDNIIKWM